MHWWQCAFTPSSKRHPDVGETYSMKPGFLSPRTTRNQWDESRRSEKLNHQALPMPEPEMVLKKKPKSIQRELDDGLERMVGQNPGSRKKQIGKARSGYRIDIPGSAPLLSPDGCDVLPTYYATPLFHVWSAPETPLQSPHPLPLPPQPAPPSHPQWHKGKLIGRGTFGSVYVASNRETGALCAMKEVEIFPDDSNSSERIRQLEQEISLLSRLKHPNIVQYFGSEIVGDKFHIYLEYVHPGSINKFIQDHFGAITESIVRNFTRHILCGLAYLHRMKTIHRDIKCANLLVDAYGVVKLADFGMAKHLNGEVADLSLKGSPYWLAPELLEGASSDNGLAVDIWSLGCTIIEMMNGKPPWSEYEAAAALFKVLKETPPIPDTLSSDGKDFLKCCFRRNPANRPTASELLDHPFVNYITLRSS